MKIKQKSEKAILYLSKHFRKKISLAEIAKTANLSPFHFHRIFVDENNCTPHNYTEKVRMQHAVHIMNAFPKWNVADIAFECGYSSPDIFSRAFKKYFGVSPTYYITETKEISGPIVEKESFKIQYLSKKKVKVKKVSLLNEELNEAIQSYRNSNLSKNTIYGFYLDAPFHVPIDQCRYYMGVELKQEEKNSSVLSFPSGYYISTKIKGDFKQLEEKVFAMNNYIRKKNFCIDSLIGYEKITLTDKTNSLKYSNRVREVFMKVKRE